jgi:hypothetical protein
MWLPPPTSPTRRLSRCRGLATGPNDEPVGAVDVGEHQDVKQLGAGSGTERI